MASRRSVSVRELQKERLLWIRQHKYSEKLSFAEQMLRVLVPDYSRERNSTMPLLLQDLFMKIRIENRLAVLPRQLVYQFTGSVTALEIEDLDTKFDMIALWKTANKNPSLRVFLDEIFRAFP